MALLIYESSTWAYNWTIPDNSVWLGVNPPKSEQTDFIFRNNLIQSNNTGGYMLQAGIDPLPAAGYNNTLDGQIISGNKFDWVDPSPGNSWWSITHGLFTGHERNAYIKHNYLNQVPMAIIRKSCNLITDTSGGIYYNIINGGGVGVNIKGLSGVRVYNNTIYGNRSVASGETWRPLIYIYTNTDTCASGTGGSPAAGTKIKNNILYTAYDQKMITLSDASCVPGFESDYNIFWKEEDGSVRFGYLGSTLTFEAWQALGYDTHSVVMDPNFIDVSTFVPTARLDYGTNLGTDYSTGLATTADWVVGTSPDLTLQNGTWQVGAVLYEAETPIESSAYYVSAAGNDASNGLTPETAWRTIDKVNASMGSIEPGESILFRRGDTFYGTINITKSGTSGNPITFGAYGTGAKPIITGFTTITSGWTNEGNGIYSRDISADQQTNMVLIDGSQYGMGRWPKGNTYNYYETLDGSLSITDNQLSGEPDWTGADVVIRHTYWLLNRYTITNHDGSTIYYNNTANIGYGYANMGYFIQNDLSTLYIDPTYGEWYHDTAQQKLYVYFGSDPGSTEVKVATKKNFVTNNEYDYLTFNGLSFIGCASTGINLASYYCTNITITDCSIQYAGLHGISEPAANSIITNNTINRCNESGITATGDNCDINYNHITNIGLIPGQAYHGGYSTGIRIGSTNAEVLYNTIENIGYCGISGGSGSSATVRYNYVNNYCLTVNDGGGLYHGHNTNPPPGQWIIEYNIFLNGYGETNGTSSPNTYLAEGIYLDSYCADASVKWNICANNRGVGIKLSSGHGNTIENNLCYNNDESQMYLAGMWSYATLYDNTIRYNQLIGKDADHLTLKVTLNASDNISNYGLSNYNFFARPVSEGATIYTSQTGVGSNYRTLSEWQSYSGQDANSLTSFTSVSSTNELEFYYNETSSNKIVASLTVPMVDVSGNTYPVGNLTLAPWTGVVLMPNNDVSVYYLAADGSDNSGDGTIENPWFSLNKVWPLLEPGDTVYMRDGSYGYTYRQYLTGKNGTANARINIWAYPGENPHIVEPDDASFARNTGYVIYFKGDYFHWKGIEISNYKQLNYDEMTFPFRSEDSDHNIFELLTVHDCGFGIHIGGSSDDNLFLNCDIYNIYDPLSTSSVDGSLVADPYEDGDGFSIGYGGLGTTNTYRGCRAWNCCDDGWDLWRSDSHVIIDRCWVFNCGFAENEVSVGGNGNGFKLGITETSTAWAEDPPVLRTITNSITYGNRTNGVHQNGSYCATQFYNNIAYDNGDYGFWMASYNIPHIFKNNISYANGYTATTTAASIVEHNTFLVGTNQTNPSFNVTDGDFISIDPSGLTGPRQANGDLPVLQFLHLSPGSDLIHAGTDISTLIYDGDGSIWNDPPSLGAFEYFGEDTSVSGLVFYVSADGSDNYDGISSSTPWKSITKLNASLGSLSSGDGVLFRRGDTFYGTVNVAKSGSAGNPITFGAYGVGDKPIISGFTEITSWTSIGGGIYTADVACESSCNMVIVDGSQYALGKWPNEGWYYIDNTDGDTYISDASITNDYNWTGAEIVIRKNRWVIDRCQITNHDGSTLTFSNTSSYPAQVSWGYFIQRSASTLDDFGDWHHDNSNGKLYMYFGAENPNNHIVKISTLDRGIYNWAYDYISVDNIRFEGANAEAFYGYNSPSHQTIQNCEIYFSGKDAIYIHYPFYCLIDNNVIDFTNSTAINATSYHSDGSTRISNNTITNTFTFPGMGHPGDGTTVAIAANGHNGIIENNTIINTGYLPINYGGRNTIVRNNYINTYCYIKDDGGGIYTYADNFTGKQVLNNIILNAIGAPNGSRINYYYPYSSANGLYADGYSSHILYEGNLVSNISKYGFHTNASSNANFIIRSNTFFQCKGFLSMVRNNSPITDVSIYDNVFISTIIDERYPQVIDINHSIPAHADTIVSEISNWGYIDNNYYYMNTEGAVTIAGIDASESAPRSIQNWANAFGHDISSSVITPIQNYTIESLGDNLLANSTFDTDIAGWTGVSYPISWVENASLDGGSLKLQNPVKDFGYHYWTSSYYFYATPSVTIDTSKNYILRVLARSDTDEKTISVRMRTSSSLGALYSYMFGDQRYFVINDISTQKEILYANPLIDANNRLCFTGTDGDVSIYFDNIEFYEASVNIIDTSQYFHLVYNISDGINKQYLLDASMEDATGTVYDAGIIDVSTWQSIVLIGEGTVTEYNGEEPSTSIPTVTTNSITDISLYSAIAGGNVTSDGSASVFSKGVCWNISINPTTSNYITNDGSGLGAYTSHLTGLNASTHYFVRAYAINDVGTAYGNNVEFDTLEVSQEQPSDLSVGLKTFLVNPYVQSRYYVSYAGKFYVLPYTTDSSVTPEPEPSTYLYKRIVDGWDESGVWASDEYCATFDTGCVSDVSFGIVTDNPIGHFTILSDIPNWLRLYDTFTEEDLSIGSHISDVSGRVFKAHPMTENNTGQDRDGSVYITNDFGQSVTFYVIQYR